MNAFKDFGIEVTTQAFTGEKIKMSKILNKQIKVLKFNIGPSKFKEKGSGKCLNMQIQIAGTMHVVFSGSVNLMDMIGKVPAEGFPFTTTIIEENERFEFT